MTYVPLILSSHLFVLAVLFFCTFSWAFVLDIKQEVQQHKKLSDFFDSDSSMCRVFSDCIWIGLLGVTCGCTAFWVYGSFTKLVQ